MKKFLGELKGARGIEWMLVVLAICILLLSRWNDGSVSSSIRTEQEQRIAAILSHIKGAGEVDVMISDKNPAGILIVAEGANDLSVSLRLQYAVQTLMGTDASRIEIIPYQK